MHLRSSSNVPPQGHSTGRQWVEGVVAILISMLVLAEMYSTRPAPLTRNPANEPMNLVELEANDQPVRVEPAIDEAMIVAPDPRPSQPEPLKMVSRDALFADLRGPLDLKAWSPSTHLNDYPGTHYGGPWLRENIVRIGNNLGLMIHAGKGDDLPTMAEFKTRAYYGYGRYEVIMKPSGETGTVSAFFTYTGPWAGNPHDEVDIEFIGRRPRHVEFNYFKNGRSGAHDKIALGFDASERLNLYAFEWHKDEIIWYVNGEEMYRTPPNRTDIPTHPGQLFISAWTGTKNMEVWTGPRKFGETAQAEYACMSFTPFGDESYSCADLWESDPAFRANLDRDAS